MNLNRKELNSFRQGRVNTLRESRKQRVLRNNLEKRFYRTLSTLFRKFLNTQLYLYKEFGYFTVQVAEQRFNEDFIPLVMSHYRRVFKAIYKNNEDNYLMNRKADEAFVFGRSFDFEALVAQYFATRQLILVGISSRMSKQISNKIEEGRLAGMTLEGIANLVSKEMTIITRSRAALIARTETHNAASFANHSYHKTVQQDLGVKMLKKWVATNDERTRSAHSEASGQTVDMDEDFIVGGVPMGYAGDSKGGAKNVINCRCVIVYADERDMEA